ncbi:hypothetical protein C8R43DRAFT_925691 [Mycena crocata]|nr:hypothetical protein C8R43DRAFT_925691 [Mycena crocata]
MSSPALAADRTRIAEIDAQIRDLQESIRLLEAERKITQDRLDAYKYPVLTLPTEITSEIFVRFIPPYPLCPPMTGRSSPTLLTHICRTWRDIALATPTLWRAVRIQAARVSDKDTAPRVLESWLRRSGSCPLSICVTGNGVQLHDIIQALNVHRARWEELVLHRIAPETISFFSEPGATPLLRYLQIFMKETPSPSFRFDEAPLLCAAVLGNNVATGFSLPWQQLTSLTMLLVHPHECTAILQQTVNLVRCEISLFPGTSEEPGVFLPHLESLVVYTVNVDNNEQPASQYLAAFIVPVLRRLDVEEAYLGSNPIRPLNAFISASGCQLQELQIIGRRISPEYSYRRAFPSIPKIIFRQYGLAT